MPLCHMGSAQPVSLAAQGDVLGPAPEPACQTPGTAIATHGRQHLMPVCPSQGRRANSVHPSLPASSPGLPSMPQGPVDPHSAHEVISQAQPFRSAPTSPAPPDFQPATHEASPSLTPDKPGAKAGPHSPLRPQRACQQLPSPPLPTCEASPQIKTISTQHDGREQPDNGFPEPRMADEAQARCTVREGQMIAGGHQASAIDNTYWAACLWTAALDRHSCGAMVAVLSLRAVMTQLKQRPCAGTSIVHA